jgi:ATP-dependent Lhr-like helicase
VLRAAARGLATLVTRGRVDKLAIETVNGGFVLGSPLGDALSEAGFLATPRGLRLRT